MAFVVWLTNELSIVGRLTTVAYELVSMSKPQKSSSHLGGRILTQFIKGITCELQWSKFGFLRDHDEIPLWQNDRVHAQEGLRSVLTRHSVG